MTLLVFETPDVWIIQTAVGRVNGRLTSSVVAPAEGDGSVQALVLRDVRDLALEELERPIPAAGEVLIEVHLAGICGSDVHGYLGHSQRRTANLPLVMGHEVVGRVVAHGEGTRNAPPIDSRVVVQPMIACRSCPTCRAGHANVCPNMQILGIEVPGGFATHVRAPAAQIYPVASTMASEVAVFAEPLAIQVRLFRQHADSLTRSVLILGAGSQGLLAVGLARMLAIPRIIVSDMVPARLELARQMGATDVLLASEDVPEAVRRMTDGLGVELAVETAGASAARTTGLAALARGGTFAIVGLGQRETAIDFLDLVGQEKSVRGVYCYSDDDFVRALELLDTGRIDVVRMAEIKPLTVGPEAFVLAANGGQEAVKVLLDPRQS